MNKKPNQSTTGAKKKGILTTAFGKRHYLKLALSLARSCHYHSPEIPLAIITDQPENRSLQHHFDYVLPLGQDLGHSGDLDWKGSGFMHKLYIDKLSPFKQTVFLDSDCLLYADISSLFHRFASRVFQPE